MEIKKLNEYNSEEEELVICYISETDGEVIAKKLPVSEIKELTKNMDSGDYALIGGDIVKNFNKSNVDWSQVGKAIKLVKKADKKQTEINKRTEPKPKDNMCWACGGDPCRC